MEYISKTLDFHVKEPSVISFGKFDGLHRGHEFLMEKQIEQSNLHGYKRIIFTFDIPPKSEVLGVESKVIITNDEKEYVFEKSGIDYLIECPFVPQVMTMEADAFVRWIVKSLNVKCIIVGDDFRFGHNRAGDHKLLSAMAGELGYDLIVVDKIKDGDRDISSTYIREEIAAGHIKKANELLGYPFFIKGRVVHGRALGRTIGIPTVNPPKSEVLGVESKVIITNDEKEYVFEKSGIDYLIECPFVPQVMTMEADAFVRWIVKSLNVKCIIVGDDFRFGHNRAGDHKLLSAMAGELGYDLIVVDKIKDGDRDISSTYIREEIAAGHIKKANELLGYPFFIKGRVVHGRALGRTIGIPTVNLSVPHDKLLPPKGVYMSRVLVRDNWYLGVTNIGCKPTIEGKNPIGAETYIIDFGQDVYGQDIMVELHKFVRPEMKFDSIEALKSQMSADINYTINYAGSHTF